MEKEEILRTLMGLIKKHDDDFSVKLKYRTTNGKLRKRHGKFVEILSDEELVLFNPDKGKKGRYLFDFIEDIKKK